MNANILSNKIGWFGKYSGYECLPNYYPDTMKHTVYSSKFTLSNRLLGRALRIKNKWKGVRSDEAVAGAQFLNKLRSSSISHILYLESHLHLLSTLKTADPRLIGTIHLPVIRWKKEDLSVLSLLENVIILYNEEISHFSKYISQDKIHFIRHGVDTEFFKPGDQRLVKKNKVLFVGHYLRNFEMFYSVYKEITRSVTNTIEFHFIIPSYFRDLSVLRKLSAEKNIFFHENLSDEELLKQYQTSNVLLMPMENSGANTAIIQALATGLPIITTDVGGIRSYGGEEIFPLLKNNDCIGMTDLFNQYYFNEDLRNNTASKQRKFALEKLDWLTIANEHYTIYKKIAGY